jgi:hypothetical protein
VDEPSYSGNVYQQSKTYHCEPFEGKARPGFEPEPEAVSQYGIVAAQWFDLRSETDWNLLLVNDPLTYLPLQRVRRKLGYLY